MAGSKWTQERLLEGVRSGDRRALARAISLVEDSDPLAYDLVRELYLDTGQACARHHGTARRREVQPDQRSVRHVRGAELTVGVISVDPSSPFSKGALLGDRIRLSDHFLDPGVFIRSMGTRGHLGGLAEATLQALLVLDAAGRDLVFLETVGTGQSEIEVIGVADTVVLVLMPGSGDSVQALKAGIMEIPDVIVVNKKDHPAAKTMLNEFARSSPRHGERLEAADRPHRGRDRRGRAGAVGEDRRSPRLPRGGRPLDARRRKNLAGEVFTVASARAKTHLEQAVADDPELRRLLDEVQRRELDPLTAVREIMVRVFKVEEDGNSPDRS